MKNLIIIPARGGSKGIPRKNLRPIAGKPLISYSIKAALNVDFDTRIVVSTDDDEIALFAERFGAEVLLRSSELANDNATLDPVIIDAVHKCEDKYNESYEHVITVQPTSPLLKKEDIENVLNIIQNGDFDTVLTVVDDRHLCWKVEDGKAVPQYESRVNRQQLPSNYKETGAVIACTREQINCGTRIGKSVGISETPYESSFDIDNFSDLYVCESMLLRKKIIFTVVGYNAVGLGHAFRTVMLANELVQYELLFICEEKSDLAINYIRSHNYKVIIAKNGELARTVVQNKPDLVINDILDTTSNYMEVYSEEKILTVNFEDMGSGHESANMVFNALYPHQVPQKNVFVGPLYFCLRDEFIHITRPVQEEVVKNVLITFGGVDEGNITSLVVNEISHICVKDNIELEIIVGPAYPYEEDLLAKLKSIKNFNYKLIKHTKRISEHMNKADVAITSGGRTVLELASLKIPTIVICQNERETTHTFASSDNGVINLGHRLKLEEDIIADTFKKVIYDKETRDFMAEKMADLNLLKGKSRVINKIKSLINN